MLRSTALVLGLLLAAVPGCAPPPGEPGVLSLRVAFDTPARAASAVRIELELFRDACGTGISVWGPGPITFVREDAMMAEGPRVPPGSYCVRAVAYDAACVRFAAVDQPFVAGTVPRVDVELVPIDARRECIARACMAGRCNPTLADAGMDAPDLAMPDFGPIMLPDIVFELPDAPLPDVGPPDDIEAPDVFCEQLTLAQLSLGAEHSCGITSPFPSGARVFCWGRDPDGRLGAGSVRHESRLPVLVMTPEPLQSITTGGAHTCGLTVEGAAYCWGDNESGQLGIGAVDTRPHPTPERLPGVLRFAAIAAGDRHTCAIERMPMPGRVHCWGDNDERQLGTSMPSAPVATPTLLPGFLLSPSAETLSAGGSLTCGLGPRGMDMAAALFCWGAEGPVLSRTIPGDGSPVLIATSDASRSYTTVRVGGDHACVVASVLSPEFATELSCWGSGANGRLGIGGGDVLTPTLVFQARGFLPPRFATGSRSTCFGAPIPELFLGPILCAGAGARGVTGPLGLDRDTTSPVAVLRQAQAFGALAVGGEHACASAGTGIVCWGDNTYGQLGTGAGADRDPVPSPVCF